jgi:hypothetical protein
MAKTGNTMAKTGNTMAKTGNTMAKTGNTMAKTTMNRMTNNDLQNTTQKTIDLGTPNPLKNRG